MRGFRVQGSGFRGQVVAGAGIPSRTLASRESFPANSLQDGNPAGGCVEKGFSTQRNLGRASRRPKACHNNSRGQRPRLATTQISPRLKALYPIPVRPLQGREDVARIVTGGGAPLAPGYCSVWPSARRAHSTRLVVIVVTALFGAALLAGVMGAAEATRPTTTGAAPVRFAAIGVYVDSRDKPLAAYQCEITAKGGDVKIVGIEGNPKIAAFAEPPYYDPKAMLDERLILAAFSTRKDLPKNNVRVATIHVQITGDAEPEYVIRLDVAATADSEPIPATGTLIQGGRQ
jgi:hypothetical protein